MSKEIKQLQKSGNGVTYTDDPVKIRKNRMFVILVKYANYHPLTTV
ncbi:hypothetical protein [Agriterribacter sp.]|nr:hypothetical protein [Agriterribacter sp.]HRP57523.1 hypothetical protein [Agriterribacter sp.]